MEVVFEPVAVFSVIVSLIIAMMSRRLARLGEYIISHASLLPIKVRTRIRVRKWRYRKYLIITARSSHKVTWAIVRTYTLLIFFVLVIALYLLLIAIGPLNGLGDLPSSVQAFIASPIYIFEALWLLQKEKTGTLVKVAEKRVTSCCSRR